MSVKLSHFALLLAVAMLLVGLGGIAATWLIADREFRDVLAQDLEQQAELLAELLTASPTRMSDTDLRQLLADAFEGDDEDTLWVTVYDTTSGHLLSNLEHDLPLEARDDGLLRRQFAGYGWHGVQENEDGIIVQLLRRDDVYADVQGDILEDIVTPALIGIGLTLLLLAVLIMLAVRPLTKLAHELEARNADSLAPLTTETPAREIRVLRDSINGLMRGIEAVVTRERQFANDVAHELRTPLTTLKLELASTEPDMRTVKDEVERLARLVEQLLTLARLERGQWQRRFDSVHLSDLCARVVEQLRGNFQRADITLESRLSAARIAGDATLLETLLRNLLQNVLEHCPAGTTASVTLDQRDKGIVLRVVDDGPGIATETLQQMALGFTRLDSKSDGFGLGLAICHRIVTAHGGEIRFSARDDGARGLAIEVRVPA
jgi:signal transduction histidine kinase